MLLGLFRVARFVAASAGALPAIGGSSHIGVSNPSRSFGGLGQPIYSRMEFPAIRVRSVGALPSLGGRALVRVDRAIRAPDVGMARSLPTPTVAPAPQGQPEAIPRQRRAIRPAARHVTTVWAGTVPPPVVRSPLVVASVARLPALAGRAVVSVSVPRPWDDEADVEDILLLMATL